VKDASPPNNGPDHHHRGNYRERQNDGPNGGGRLHFKPQGNPSIFQLCTTRINNRLALLLVAIHGTAKAWSGPWFSTNWVISPPLASQRNTAPDQAKACSHHHRSQAGSLTLYRNVFAFSSRYRKSIPEFRAIGETKGEDLDWQSKSQPSGRNPSKFEEGQRHCISEVALMVCGVRRSR
jgi:hypothetical protein